MPDRIKLIYKEATDRGTWGATWFVHAPWAHLHWCDYLGMAYSLNVSERCPEPAKLARPGMTHEFLLFALDPSKRVDYTKPVEAQLIDRLWPPNYGYQFACDSNEEAFKRLHTRMQEIAAGKLSPDTDFRLVWDAFFLPAGVSLIVNQFELAAEKTRAGRTN